MFTGIIEELGHIESLTPQGSNVKLTIAAREVLSDAREGDSIAVNGVCLTAVEVTDKSFAADVSRETLERSTLGSLTLNSKVNLERAVTPNTRLGGHIVQGHVDGRGQLLSIEDNNGSWTLRVGYPPELKRYVIHKGSISVEGISLTIAKLTDEWFEIAVIPKTWDATNLRSLRTGDSVNLEVDMIAKYVERIMQVAR